VNRWRMSPGLWDRSNTLDCYSLCLICFAIHISV
jgi:hypothetical protein